LSDVEEHQSVLDRIENVPPLIRFFINIAELDKGIMTNI
jgi:hypothetical protein